jgi:hypothetical protein
MSAPVSGPGRVLRRFLADDPVTRMEILQDLTPWEVCFDATPEQAARWDGLITAMAREERMELIGNLELPDPTVSIGLDEQLRKGIAQQLRVLADLLDPPIPT